MKPYQVISSKTVFEGRILNVKHDIISTPDGGEMLREIVVSREAAAVVPVDNDGNIVFVRQYRHAVQQMVLEIPAGIIEKDEKPENCALRELEEETGYAASNIKYVTGLNTTIGFCTEIVHLFIAEGLTKGRQKLDPDEFVTIETYTPQEAVNMIKSMEIKDGKTIAGILYYCREKGI